MDNSTLALVVDREPARVAAQRAARALRAVPGGRPRLAIAGGSVLSAVWLLRRELGASWRTVRLTWVDERCVPFDDERSNRGMAYRLGALDHADPPALELPLFLDGESSAEASERVARELSAQFRDELDVLLVGMGEDGHVASLFPGHVLLGSNHNVGVLCDSPKPPSERVTLTLKSLSTAETSILFAAGDGKRSAIQRLLAGDSTLPASRLRGVTLVTDQVL